MAKVEINQVAEAAKATQLTPSQIRELIEKLNLMTEPDEEKAPAIKKQYAILISDPDGLLPKADFVGWVLQIPEEESVATTQDRILRGAYDFNASKKGRLLPVKTIGEALEHVAARFFKEADLWVKTKSPVLMLRTSNEIPDGKQGKLFEKAGDL